MPYFPARLDSSPPLSAPGSPKMSTEISVLAFVEKKSTMLSGCLFLGNMRYLFYQPMDEKIKTWPLHFPAKKNPNMRKSLFDWPIVLQYDVKSKYRLISRKFSGMKFFHRSARLTNHKPRAFVSVRQTNEIALFPFVCCFCFVRAFSFQGHTKIALSKR